VLSDSKVGESHAILLNHFAKPHGPQSGSFYFRRGHYYKQDAPSTACSYKQLNEVHKTQPAGRRDS